MSSRLQTLSYNQLLAHDADLRELLSNNPHYQKHDICSYMFHVKEYKVWPNTAQQYLRHISDQKSTDWQSVADTKSTSKIRSSPKHVKRRRISKTSQPQLHSVSTKHRSTPTVVDVPLPISFFSIPMKEPMSGLKLHPNMNKHRISLARYSPHDSDDDLIEALDSQAITPRDGHEKCQDSLCPSSSPETILT